MKQRENDADVCRPAASTQACLTVICSDRTVLRFNREAVSHTLTQSDKVRQGLKSLSNILQDEILRLDARQVGLKQVNLSNGLCHQRDTAMFQFFIIEHN